MTLSKSQEFTDISGTDRATDPTNYHLGDAKVCFKTHESVAIGSATDNEAGKVLEKQHLNSKQSSGSRDYVKRTLSQKLGSEDVLEYYEYVGKPIKRLGRDDREYRLIKLTNNLEVMLVSGSEDDLAAATMDVGVGSTSDPKDFNGLAHFCEHMLFMGTEDYPEPDQFLEVLTKNGGGSNAYTAQCNTKYYFSVVNSALEMALDRFSSFFTKPLFKADFVDREVKNVDSEFKGRINSDSSRLYQLSQSLADPDHVINKFNIGSMETLANKAEELGVSLRDIVYDFYSKYYSSDIMKLAITGSQSLDQLTEWAVCKFSDIKSKGKTVPDPVGVPYGPNELCRMIRYKTVKDTYTLAIDFSLPDLKPFIENYPTFYPSKILTRKHKNSLHSFLERKGWITYLYASKVGNPVKGYDLYNIFINLTESGYQNYLDVLRAVFSYINMVKQTPPVKRIYDEVAQSALNTFEFTTIDYGSSFTNNITSYMNEEYTSKDKMIASYYLFFSFSENNIQMVLDHLNIRNCNIFIGSKEDKEIEYPLSEKHFGTQYRVDPIGEELLKELEEIDPYDCYKMPQKNELICWDLEMVTDVPKCEKPDLQPTLLVRNKHGEVWYRRDDRFLTPKGRIHVTFSMPKKRQSAENCVALSIFLSMIRYEFCELVDGAGSAGFSYGLYPSGQGMGIDISGYTPKMLQFFYLIINNCNTAILSKFRFEVLKEDSLRRRKNMDQMDPDDQALRWQALFTTALTWSDEQIIKATENMTFESMVEIVNDLLGSFYTETLVVGSFTEDIAIKVHEKVHEAFKPNTVPIAGTYPLPFIIQKPGLKLAQHKSTSEKNPNSAFTMTLFAKRDSRHREMAYLYILFLTINSKFYNRLRTNESIGYAVYCTQINYSPKHFALQFVVTSECSPAYIHLRYRYFIKHFRQKVLVELTEEDIKDQAEKAIKRCEEPDHDIYEEADSYSSAISNKGYDFFYLQSIIENLKTVSKDGLIEFWDKHIDPLSRYRNGREVEEDHDVLPAIAFEVFSPKSRVPTLQERQKYPGTILALYGCLEREKIKNVDYAHISEVVDMLHQEYSKFDDKDDADSNYSNVIDGFKELVVSRVSDVDHEALEKAFEEEDSYSTVALKMAMNDYIKPPSPSVSQESSEDSVANRYAKILYDTPDGYQVFENYKEYCKLLVHGDAPESVHDLIPKYPDYKN
ncbi:metalloprotease [Mycoemilia scoparia]|uniref:Metalloprotease n=1 Tax=Mycoemilia scoparia TaxID=417184 RepID=A0A9W7ZU97_9FUNG|nr:metalloprotease [Mycoemilia scoparia]